MTRPRHLLAAWPAVARQVRSARRIALFTDFDGTLARIRRHPAEVFLSPGVRRALAAFPARGVLLGVVSGRALDDLVPRVALPRIWYVGAHGFFLRDPAGRVRSLLTAAQRRRIERARRWLARRLRSCPGIRIEPKAATVAVHFRGASRASEARARAAVEELLRRSPALSLLPGKKVWEVLPAARVDKWRAIQRILRRSRASRPALALAIYLGDDRTDEAVFRRMRGITVQVGDGRRTAARFYLRSPAEVRLALERLRAAVPEP